MARFSKVTDFFNNMNRSVLLALGLIVIAVLVAATFALGDTDEVAEEPGNGDATQQEQQQEGGADETGENGAEQEDGETNGGGEAAAEPTEDGSNGEGTESDGEVAQTGGDTNEDEGGSMPSQLADTGPVTSAAAALLLGAGGYLYHRSRSDLEEHRKE